MRLASAVMATRKQRAVACRENRERRRIGDVKEAHGVIVAGRRQRRAIARDGNGVHRAQRDR